MIKLNNAGAVTWIRQFGTTSLYTGGDNIGNDMINSLTVDHSGKIYFAGSSNGNFSDTNGGGASDAIIGRLNADATLDWGVQNGTGGTYTATGSEECLVVTIDLIGNVICGGISDAGYSEANAGGSDIHIWRINNNGSL